MRIIMQALFLIAALYGIYEGLKKISEARIGINPAKRERGPNIFWISW